MIKMFLAMVFFGAMLLLAGCESMQEDQGYSRIPQNRPSSWENNPMQNVPK